MCSLVLTRGIGVPPPRSNSARKQLPPDRLHLLPIKEPLIIKNNPLLVWSSQAVSFGMTVVILLSLQVVFLIAYSPCPIMFIILSLFSRGNISCIDKWRSFLADSSEISSSSWSLWASSWSSFVGLSIVFSKVNCELNWIFVISFLPYILVLCKLTSFLVLVFWWYAFLKNECVSWSSKTIFQ